MSRTVPAPLPVSSRNKTIALYFQGYGPNDIAPRGHESSITAKIMVERFGREVESNDLGQAARKYDVSQRSGELHGIARIRTESGLSIAKIDGGLRHRPFPT